MEAPVPIIYDLTLTLGYKALPEKDRGLKGKHVLQRPDMYGCSKLGCTNELVFLSNTMRCMR